ncbi:uncharacterized protein LOC123311165 [Coccinella septempunctata]|uniref:uncharacterized protein LOC123311165 n=1 Tax=Coccinella septempunctata TaxID=41139 RepID=UPI001D071577|nr:uncharacterized protein LOC123311165 [Coccinella septempunctata]XP_044750905.1 uncharacterized protein LOC123311165 [Coccinella septempunctata]
MESIDNGVVKIEQTCFITEDTSSPLSPSCFSNLTADEDDSNVDVDKLIAAVQIRPCLWNKYDPNFQNRAVRTKLWEQIFVEIYPHWATFSGTDKKLKGGELQKKWRNLRDSFFRELTMRRKYASGLVKKKKRPYIHGEALSFLASQQSSRKPIRRIASTTAVNRIKPTVVNTRIQRTANSEEYTNPSDEEDSTGKKSDTKRIEDHFRRKSRMNHREFDGACSKFVERKYDEDVSFCEMLIPMLKNLSKQQKHFARIEILNVLNIANNMDS